jgi:Ferritin-like domain
MQGNDEILRAVVDPGRRTFFKNLGKLGLGATAGGLLLSNLPRLKAQSAPEAQDTANQIFTAALVAEDLATTFYYNGLVGPVIQDPALAGPGGTATDPSPSGNVPNVDYIRAAMGQEIQHANLLRAVANLGSTAATDPYQTFYFPAGTFDTLSAFIATLEALENAFIGAYLVASREFAALASSTASTVPDGPYGGPYSAAQLDYFAQVAASILGIEAEHRVLGQVILNANQPNDRNYEQTDGLLTVYNGPNSAVAALTPFLTPATGPGYSLATALSQASTITLPSTGGPPAYTPASLTASPNPIPVAQATNLGMTTISWNAPSATYIQVRVGAPDGPLFTDNFNTGSAPTGLWVTDGMIFYLQDVSTNQPLTAANTLATLTVHLKKS